MPTAGNRGCILDALLSERFVHLAQEFLTHADAVILNDEVIMNGGLILTFTGDGEQHFAIVRKYIFSALESRLSTT